MRRGRTIPEKGQCALHLVIINRNSSQGRGLMGINELKALLDHRTFCGARITYEEHRFDSLSFNEQAEIMQRADIVLSAHGAELTNAIFLREGSVVIEMAPFAYYTG
eukprot:CAMPEP_0184684790 /NCGR_PEP_ID=MMETSP0312-20130426/16717_1 /TAXON_ID=31354 /ORGANISM="Compsopogon coeruleus, Strain SAG 36.94" /LENGTH=106 /DNA_ID=CAMNT_0027138343 /DNA_START=142 /DNA_END=458 /DNA_ORIENTATION=-